MADDMDQHYTKEITVRPADITLKCTEDGVPTGDIGFTVATLGVRDKHGDVLTAGFCKEQRALISQFQHAIWDGAAPVGNGRVYEQDNKLLFDGKIDMRTETGKEFWHAVDFNKELLEVSFGFYITKYSFGELDELPVLFVHEAEVMEVSPVISGAGIGTGVRHIKSNRPPEPQPEPEPIIQNTPGGMAYLDLP